MLEEAMENAIIATASVLGAALAIGLAALGVGLGMGIATKAGLESMARQPEMEPKIRTWMIVGLAMLESLALYALVIALILILANPFVK
jgi:F-type H+-transporting ATPase subunit c